MSTRNRTALALLAWASGLTLLFLALLRPGPLQAAIPSDASLQNAPATLAAPRTRAAITRSLYLPLALKDAASGALLTEGGLTAQLSPHPVQGYVLDRLTLGLSPTRSVTYTLAPGPLWRLQLWDPSIQKEYEITPALATRFQARPWQVTGDRGVELVWSGLQDPTGGRFTVTVRVHMRAGDPLLRFTGRVAYDESSGGRAGIERFDLPLLDLEDKGPRSELYLGALTGLRVRDPARAARTVKDEPLDLLYPSGQNLALNAYADPVTGTASLLLLSVDDPPQERFALKHFLAGGVNGPDDGGPYLRLALGRRPVDPLAPHDVTLAGDAVLGILPCRHEQSCWFDAAAWYRERVAQEGFLERGPLAMAGDLPAHLLDHEFVSLIGHVTTTALVTMPTDFAGYREYLQVMGDYLGAAPTETVSIWYDWPHHSFDQQAPEHFPARPGFVENVQKAVASGYRILPYTIPTAWDPKTPSYTQEQVAQRGVLVRRDGRLVQDEKGITTLDMGATLVQSYYPTNVIEPLYRDHGVTGIYLDFFPNAVACFADGHGHPVGGGDSFAQGARGFYETVAQLGEKYVGDGYIVSEGGREYGLDQLALANTYPAIDFWHVHTDTQQYVGYIPLFDAVYHEYAPMGNPALYDMPGDPILGLAKSLADGGNPYWVNRYLDYHHMVLGWTFAYGQRAVVFRRPITDTARTPNVIFLKDDPYFEEEVAFYRDTVQLRQQPALKPFLTLGRMAPPPRVITVTTVSSMTVPGAVPLGGDLAPFELTSTPSVFHAAFQDQEGNLAVTVVNWRGTAQPFHFVLNPDDYGMGHNGQALTETWRVMAYTKGVVGSGLESGWQPVDSQPGVFLLTEDLNSNPEWLAPNFLALPPRSILVLVYEKVTPGPLADR